MAVPTEGLRIGLGVEELESVEGNKARFRGFDIELCFPAGVASGLLMNVPGDTRGLVLGGLVRR